MLKRLLKLPKNADFFLFGPRQTGKTTLIKAEFPDVKTRFYDFLKISTFMRFSENLELFTDEVKSCPDSVSHVVIDEVQKLPQILDQVQLAIEARKEHGPFFVLTGSSARKLKRKGVNLLGGRAWTLSLFPLSFFELGQLFNLKRALEVGTLAGIFLQKDDTLALERLRSYVETYLKEEIQQEALVRSVPTFVKFLFVAGLENGNIINFSNIARDVATSHTTVQTYFQILEDTLIGAFLYPYGRSVRKRLARHPKFYICDTGIQRAMAKRLTVELHPQTPEFGQAFETWIVNQCRLINHYFRKDMEMSYFRTEAGAEVDLICEMPTGEILAIEIKSSTQPRPIDYRAGFSAFKTVTKKCRVRYFCVCNAEHPRKDDEINVLPWKNFFELLRDY